MKFIPGEQLNRIISIQKRLTATFVLLALLSAVLPVFALSNQETLTPANSVYCPLSKKFQSVNPPQTRSGKQPFDAICAGTKTKELLFQEIVFKTPWRVFTLDAKNFENLVFDYLAHGKSALGKLPYAPNAPSKNRIEQIIATVVSNSRDDHRFAWKYSAAAAIFSPNLKPRPPTAGKSFFIVQIVRPLESLSLQIAPRAPPFLS